MTFEIGSRVKVNAAVSDRYLQPWRDRFAKGRQGTVVALPGSNVRGFLVEFDHGKVKYPDEWRIVIIERDLVLA